MLETIEKGKPETPFLRFGDRVRIEMKLPDGQSIFGAIDQTVARYEGPKLNSTTTPIRRPVIACGLR